MKLQMRNPTTVPQSQLESIVTAIQALLWLDDDGINPGKEWNAETLERIAEVLTLTGLSPYKE